MASLLFIAATGLLATHTRIGVDVQKRQCVPYKLLLEQYGNPGKLARGDLVTFVTKKRMGHGFDGQIITKFVGALPGDHVLIKDDVLYINGSRYGVLDLVTKLHKQHGAYDLNEVVPAGSLFVVGNQPRTYDSRYWGLLPSSDVVGRAFVIPYLSDWSR